MKKSILKSIMTLALLLGASGVMGQNGTLTVTRTESISLKDAIANELTATNQKVKDITKIVVISDGSLISEGDYKSLREYSETITEDGVDTTYELKDYLKEADLTAATGAYGFLPANAFKELTTLETVTLNPSCVGIYGNAFDGCTNLKTVTNLSNITRIASYAFRNCINLELSVLPPKLATLNEHAFNGCTKVDFSEWPQTITTIEGNAFAGTAVSFKTWPLSGATIGGNALYNCPKITEFTIPEHITTIGPGAFYLAAAHSDTSRDIYLIGHDTAPNLSLPANSWTYGAFLNNNNTRIHVKASAKGTYIDKPNEGTLPPANWSHMTFVTYAKGSTTLTGTWTQEELEAMDITDADLTDIDMTNIIVPAGVTLSGATNPNLLVYTGATDDVTINGMGNLIKDGTIDNLTITDRAPFNAPADITGAISYQRTMAPLQSGNPALETICLPFTTAIPAGCRVMAMAAGGSDEEINLTEVSTMTANTPYVIYPGEAAETAVTFTGTSIVATSMIDNEASANYILKGTFANNIFEAGNGIYVSDGSSFRPAAGATLAPFRAYLELKEDAPEGAPAVYIKEPGSTGIDENSATYERIQFYFVNDQLYINSPVAKTISIYSIDGRLVQTEMIDEGETSISGLAKGIYIIEQQKVIVR